MTNYCWFANSASIKMYNGGDTSATAVTVGALKNVKFSPKFEIAELRGMESIMRQCIAKYNYEVDVSFEYAMWDSTADVILFGMLAGGNVAESTGVGTIDDTAAYRNKVATFTIEATVYDTTNSATMTATAYGVYFTEIPFELRENEYISRNMSGKARSIAFGYYKPS
jgi:hypothetical protein